MAAADASRSGATADSYIGSLISLTSKCEIRYEGVLFNINTEESSIGLRNVRSFGTEGRKKDGQQIPPSDKIYEYILFRGSDIKDLQVKSSPSVQTAPAMQDPAIIQQSQYPRPSSSSASMPSVGTGTLPDISSHTGQVGIPRTTFQGNLPLYQPGGSIGSWGSSPPTANGAGLAMPVYWQGYYTPSGGLTHLHQPPQLRPPPGLSMPLSMQQPLQYPGFNSSLPSMPQNMSGANASLPSGSLNLLTPVTVASASLPSGSANLLGSITGANAPLPSGSLNFPGTFASLPSGSSNMPELPPLLPPNSGMLSLSSATLSSSVPPTQATTSAPEMPSTMPPNKPLVTSLTATTVTTSLPFISTSVAKVDSSSAPVSSKPRNIPAPNLTYQVIAQPVSSTVGLSNSSQAEAPVPSLVTPDQLLQPGPSTISSLQPLQTVSKEVEDKAAKSVPLKSSPVEANEPILPLPKPHNQKPNGLANSYHNNKGRGRGRGRGNGFSRPLTKFTEDFDFIAMNEKFKKDEVWGHLGKSKAQSRDNEDYDDDDYAQIQEEEDAGSSKTELKPVYVKDDFFDTLSCNALDRGDRSGRMKFSEQLKIDTETFGDIPRHRANRGGGRGFRGGRTRGYYGRGYGHAGRGWGPPASNRAM